MIFLLATLPKSQYNVLLDIFKKFEEGTLVRPNKTDSHIKFDCKGSNFRGLRNLDPESILKLLNEIQSGSLALHMLNSRCQQLKKLRDLKTKFVKFCGLASWEDAQAAYPDFADEEILKTRFISLSKDMQPLADYCQKAMK